MTRYDIILPPTPIAAPWDFVRLVRGLEIFLLTYLLTYLLTS